MSSPENENKAGDAPDDLECISPDNKSERLAIAYISRALRESSRLDATAWRLVSFFPSELMRYAAEQEDPDRARISMRLASMLCRALDSWGGKLS